MSYRRHTHEDLRRAGIINHDEGRTCLLCKGDVPSGYRYEHGQGVCVQVLNYTPAGRSTAAIDTTLMRALDWSKMQKGWNDNDAEG